MTNRKSNAIISIIAFLCVAFFVVLGVGIILKYTNNGNEEFKTFCVKYGGEILSSDVDTPMKLESGKFYCFEVGYPLDFGKQETPRDYSVQVVNNKKVFFSYSVDGENYSWSYETHDLSENFGLKKQATSFTLFIPENTSLQTILQTVYEGAEINSPSIGEIGSEYLYTLVVSSYNENITYRVALALQGDEI